MMLKLLKERAYTPYSRHRSVAIVKSKEGAYFPGVRVENISFPLIISSSQSAVFSCLSEGHHPEILFTNKEISNRTDYECFSLRYELKQKDIKELSDPSFEPVLLSLDKQEIYPTLKEKLDNPYVEESNFPVAALVETEKGYISGINIELSNWSLGLCAERVALAKAISYGYTHFKTMHLTTLHGEYNSPCGACRQVIAEHLPHHPIYLHYADGSHTMHYSSDLLPYSFQSNTLQKDNA